jgi:hypothetical protein
MSASTFSIVGPMVQQQITHVLYILVNVVFPTIERTFRAMQRGITGRQPYHTSILSGNAWVQELLHGHPKRIRTELGVHKHVFRELIFTLYHMGHRDSRYITLEEQLAIFLYTCVTGLTSRHVGERFQHTGETISRFVGCTLNFQSLNFVFFRYFREMASIFSSPPFYTKYVRQPTASESPSPYIRNNPKLWPFLKKAVGAIDGSHIHLNCPSSMHVACRNRKGFISQNCLFCCSFDMLFTYALTGWEGSISDSRLWEKATAGSLRIPEGCFLLADAGFPNCEELLVPYRSVRYHLAEHRRAGLR